MSTEPTTTPLSPFAKQILLTVATVLFSAFLSWSAFARSIPTKTEVIELIQTAGPYVEDRKLLLRSIEGMGTKLDRVIDDIASLKVENAKLAVQLEAMKVAVQLSVRNPR